MQTAYNPETGDTLVLVDNEWVRPDQIAKNDAGEAAYLIKNQWMLPGQELKPTGTADSTGLSAELAPEQFKSGVAGMQQGYYANAAKNNAALLNVMDQIDSGKRVTPIDDVLGYQDMNPAQRKQVKDSIQSTLTGTVAKTIKYGEEQKGYKRNPYADQVISLANEKDFKGAWNAFQKDPAGVIQQLAVESSPNALPSLVGGGVGVLLKGGVAGLMTGLATGSFPVEFVSSITDSLRESGVDLKDEKAVEAKLRDPAFIEAAGKRAMTRGTVIAAADAASGKLLMPFKAGQLSKNAARAAGNVVIETGTEMGGEAAAQIATGEDLKAGDILAEGLGAGPQAVGTTALKTITESKKPAAPTTEPPAAPPTPTPTPGVVPPTAAAPVETAPPSLSRDTEAMLAELMGQQPTVTPAAPQEELLPAQPVVEKQQAAPIPTVAPIDEPINKTTQKEQPAPTKTKVEPVKVDRLQEPEVQASLKRYANESGWAEIGGRLLRENAEDNTSAVTGRTRWTPNASWWTNRPVNLKGDINGRATQSAVNKALRGEKLTPNEKKMVDFLVNMHDTDMTEGDRLRAEMEERDRQVAEFNKQFEVPQTQEEAAATQAEQEARIKSQKDEDIQAEMDALAERDRAEVARLSAQQAENFALGQTPEESLTGQQRLAGQDDDIPFFSMERPNAKPYTRQVANNERVLNEKIAELTSINIKRAAIHRRLAKDKLKPLDQFEAKNLYEKAKEIEDDIESLKWATRNLTAEKFMARATDALAKDEISREVYDVINDIFKKNPNLLEGLRLQIKQGAEENGNTNFQTAGEFIGRIVRLYKGTSGTEDPSIVRHELTHSLEQVMSKDAKKKLVQEWRNKLDKAQKTEKTPEGRAFFNALFEHLKNPSRESFGAASNLMPVGKKEYYYQFMSPSEYWAVNAEKLLAANLGGAWTRFRNFVRGLFESLKSLFGFDNNSTIHKVFNEVITGKREGTTMLTDLQGGVTPTKTMDVSKNNAFKRWFGDSKVVNDNNEPLVVYHGTSADITEFQGRKDLRSPITKLLNYFGAGFPNPWDDQSSTRNKNILQVGATWFTSSPDLAGGYATANRGEGAAPNIIPVYLSIKNPAIYDAKTHILTYPDGTKKDYSKIIPEGLERFYSNWETVNHEGLIAARKSGADGVILRNVYDAPNKDLIDHAADIFITFKPNQIKSAVGNAGEFNPASPNITLAMEEKRLPPGRSSELTAAAQKLQKGQLTAAEYDELVNLYNPIRVFDKVPEPASKEKMYEALDSGKRDKINPTIENGHKVGLRLDIPAARKGAAVVSIHQKRTPSSPGASMGYTNAAIISNVTFGIGNEKKALEIASGKAKDALQTIEGTWVNVPIDKIQEVAQKYFNDPEWTQVGIDPTRHSYFYDRKTTQPVIKADGVVQIGNFVLAKNVQYAPKESFLFSMEPKQTPTEKAKHRNIEGMIVSPTWSGPEVSKIDDLLYKIQDKNIDTKRVIQAIEKEAGALDDRWNVYLKEELYHGRTSAALRKFLLQDLMPTIKDMARLGISPEDMKEYLHNRHAEERNDQIAKIRPATLPDGSPNPSAMTDKGSGLSYKQIKDYFNKLDPVKAKKLEQVAKDFDEMIAGTQNILVSSGAETQETIDAWNKTYKNYVPLFRVDDDFATHPSQGTGKGFSSSGGASKRATGSEKDVQDILANIIAQRERALIKAEKIRVGQALYGLAIKNPNPEFWLPINPDAVTNEDTLAAELDSMGLDGQDIAGVMQEIKKPEVVMDRQTGLQTVRYKINPLERYKDNVFPVRVNGKDRYIFFNANDPRAKRMVEAMKNLDTEQLGSLLGLFGKFTRWFAAVNTQYNPVFGGINFLRDTGGAQFNLSTTKIAGKQGAVNAEIFPSMKAIWSTLKAERNGLPVPNTKMAKLWDEFKIAGGQTLYRDSLVRKAEEKQLIEHELARLRRGPLRKAFSGAIQILSDFNDTIENAVRLSAYKVAIDSGLSKEQAASIAKNLTVNFDRKGQLGSRVNALYAFFNASMQGSARLMETLRGPQGRKIIAGGILLGAAQSIALALAGFDEDEPPEFLKERNLVIPLGGKKYFLIPMPLGLHFIPTVGRITTDFVLHGGKDAGKHVANIFGTALDAFNPLGGAGLSLQTLTPTIFDPLAALEANKDAFGRPIYRADRATNPTPGYSRSRESASTINKYIAEFLNYASGGTKYQKGAISPTADALDYLVGQVTGGVGREIMKIDTAVKSAVTGEELPAYRIPIAGRFYGDADSKAADSQRFYDNVTKIASLENEIKGRRKNREDVSGFMRDNPQARLWQQANNVENQISELNRRKKDFQERGLPREKILAIDNQKQVIMRRFNDRVKELER